MADDLQNDKSKKLAGFIASLEQVAGEKAELAEAENAILKEVTGEGFDKNVVKMILKRRKLGDGQTAVIDDLVASYEAAIKRQGDIFDNLKPRIPIGRGAADALDREKTMDEKLADLEKATEAADRAIDAFAGPSPRKPTGGASAAGDKAKAAGFTVADMSVGKKPN